MKQVEAFVDSLPGRNKTITIKDVIGGGLVKYAGVFILGGHAPMVDLANNPEVGEVLTYFHQASSRLQPYAMARCRFSVPTGSNGIQKGERQLGQGASRWLDLRWLRMTVFSNSEEDAAVKSHFNGSKPIYFAVSGLSDAGGTISVGADWTSHVVVDGELITGQNPMSDAELADALIQALDAPLKAVSK